MAVPQPCMVVSCDIVGHSGEPDADRQVAHVSAINSIVRPRLKQEGPRATRWASGGDGGYVLFLGDDRAAEAIDLIVAFRQWSSATRVPLRVTANTGTASFIDGADGRADPIGQAMNLAGRLVRAGDDASVLVTEPFARACRDVPGVRFHDGRRIVLRYFAPVDVYLLSVGDQVVSRRPSDIVADDRLRLQEAVGRRDGMGVLLHAKRLLQVDPTDDQALGAVRAMVAARWRTGTLADDLLLDRRFGEDVIRAAQLVDRRAGHVLCNYGDGGQTMFLVLDGRLEGFVPHIPKRAAADGSSGGGATPKPFYLGPGALVGEMAFVLRRPRSATLRCVEDASLLALDYQAVLDRVVEPAVRQRIERTILETVEARVLQNFCDASDAFAPARNAKLFRPDDWTRLSKYATLRSIPRSQGVIETASEFASPGIYALISGIVRERGSATAAAPMRQLLFVQLGHELRSKPATFELLDDVKVLVIESRGLTNFSPQAQEQITAGLRAFGHQMTPAAKQSSPAARDARAMVDVRGIHAWYRPQPGAQVGNVLFVHGLDGDPVKTWQANRVQGCWPSWLGEDLVDVGTWSVGYDAGASNWTGSSMPVFDRAANVLATLQSAGLLRDPLVFVCHSLGGLLVKEMLRLAHDAGVAAFAPLTTQTRGIAFLSTPHAGSGIANVVKAVSLFARPTASVDELQRNDARLRELGLWYRTHAPRLGIRTLAFCEKRKVGGLLVVDETSADPGIAGVVPIPMDEDHVTICKPSSREHLVFVQVRDFARECFDRR